MQVKEEPREGRQRTRSETIADVIPCEECGETFDSRQMKNDHFLLSHPPPVTADEFAPEKENSAPKVGIRIMILAGEPDILLVKSFAKNPVLTG